LNALQNEGGSKAGSEEESEGKSEKESEEKILMRRNETKYSRG
jgi:hypothetical protein